MKKFIFKYESILKLRVGKEDEIKNQLAKHMKIRDNLNNILAFTKEKQQAYFDFIQEQTIKGCTRKDLVQISQGQKYYRGRLEEILKKIEINENNIKIVQKQLVEAMRERKIMDKLKERAKIDFLTEVNKEEMKVTEEIVNYKNYKLSGED